MPCGEYGRTSNRNSRWAICARLSALAETRLSRVRHSPPSKPVITNAFGTARRGETRQRSVCVHVAADVLTNAERTPRRLQQCVSGVSRFAPGPMARRLRGPVMLLAPVASEQTEWG